MSEATTQEKCKYLASMIFSEMMSLDISLDIPEYIILHRIKSVQQKHGLDVDVNIVLESVKEKIQDVKKVMQPKAEA